MFTNRIYLYGYKRASRSLCNLQAALQEKSYKVVRRSPKSTLAPRKNDLVILWGASSVPTWVANKQINTPQAVELATDKLKTFKRLKECNVSIPEFTEDIEEAKSWLPDSYVVCRTLLRSSGGKGIVLAKAVEDVVDARLYVKYRRKHKEYRCHVWKGTIIDVQEKRRKSGVQPGAAQDNYIRSHLRGWVFCRSDIIEPPGLRELAISAVRGLGLDFGAVDIIYNEKVNKLYVLEVNTAPGIEGSTVENYVEAIINNG